MKKTGASLLILFAAILILYLPAIGNHPLFSGDDQINFLFAPVYTGPFGEVWANLAGNIQTREFLPIGWSLAFLEVRLFGADPVWIRFISVLLHTLATLLLWRIFLSLSENDHTVSVLSALIYAVLPINVEAVLFASGQFWQLSTVFGFSSLLFFLHSFSTAHPNRAYLFYGLSLLCFALGLLSKTGITVLPIILFWIAAVRLAQPLKKSLLVALPFLAIALLNGALIYLLSFSHYPVPQYPGDNMIVSFISHLPLFLKGVRNIFLPLMIQDGAIGLSLSFLYPFQLVRDFGEGIQFFLLGTLGLSIVGGLWWAAGRTRLATAGALWFLTNQSFFMGLLPQQWWPMADRYQYLGVAGLILVTVLAGTRMLRSIESRWLRWISGGVLALYFLFLFSLAAVQTEIWLNEKRAHQQNLFVLGDDLSVEYLNVQRSVQYSKHTLQVYPLDESLDDWEFRGAEFHRITRLAHHPEAGYYRFKNQYYRTLAFTAIHERRQGDAQGLAYRKLQELLRVYRGNPYLALYGALYHSAFQEMETAGSLLEIWKSSPLTRFEKLKTLIHSDLTPQQLQFEIVGRGNFLKNIEVFDNTWLFLDLYHRYLSHAGRTAEVREIETMYAKLYPLYYRQK